MKVQTTKQKALDYLCHHGVEGQKWGVKHGPPYPLDDSVSTGNKLKKRSNKEIAKSIKAKKKTGEPLDDEERIYRNTKRAAMVGGPLAGIIAGGITSRKIKKQNEARDKKAEEENDARETVYDSKSKKFIVPNKWEGNGAVVKISKTVDNKCRQKIVEKATRWDLPTEYLKDMDLVEGNEFEHNGNLITTLTYVPKKWVSPFCLFDVEIHKDLKTNKVKIVNVSYND